MSSKPSCAEKHPRSRSRTCSRRWRAWRQSIMSIYMFSAHSPSRLLGQNSGGTETFGCYGYRRENTKSSSSLYLCVSVPFSRGSRRHTEGLLEVELAHTDGVCRLWQADAAISEELKTSSWAGFLSRKKTETVGTKHKNIPSILKLNSYLKFLTWVVGVGGGVSASPEPMALRNRIIWRQRSHFPCSSAVLKSRVACCLLTAGTSIFCQRRTKNVEEIKRKNY